MAALTRITESRKKERNEIVHDTQVAIYRQPEFEPIALDMHHFLGRLLLSFSSFCASYSHWGGDGS